jgi:hypothetical protein
VSRKLLTIASLIAATAALVRRRRQRREEQDLWTEATAPPDLR